MWQENDDGEWYWPLHPERQQDHVRVWLTRPLFKGVAREAQIPDALDGWRGALVIDGEYLDPTRVGPFETAQEARDAAFMVSAQFLTTWTGSILARQKGGERG